MFSNGRRASDRKLGEPSGTRTLDPLIKSESGYPRTPLSTARRARGIPKGGDGAALASMPVNQGELEPEWNQPESSQLTELSLRPLQPVPHAHLAVHRDSSGQVLLGFIELVLL
jgi:hypothetical protein